VRAPPADQAAGLGTRPVGSLLWESCSQTTMAVSAYGGYALTNAWFVAHGVGATAMAAVTVVAPVALAVNALATTVGVGGACLVSRSLGAGDTASAARAAGNAFALFWVAAIAMSVVGLAALQPLLTVLGAYGGVRDLAGAYATVLLPATLAGTGFSSLVRAEGRMRFAALMWIVAIVTQATLDPVLIFGLHLGVRGAALGTVGGQSVSALMSIWFFFRQRQRPYRVRLADMRPHWPTVRALVGIGSPSFLAGLGATVLAILVNSALARTGSATALAGYAVCARIQTFVMMPQLGLSQGLQPVVGYNHGRGLPERVRRARNLTLRACAGYGIVVVVALIALAGPIASVFIGDPVIAATARHALRVLAPGLAVAGVTPLVSAYFQSLGRPKPSYLLSLGTLLAVKIPLVIGLGRIAAGGHGGPDAVWVALAAGEMASAVAALAVLRRLRDRVPAMALPLAEPR
jgi:putative MATE family efflux protein